MKFQYGDKVRLNSNSLQVYTIKDSCQNCQGCGWYELQEISIPIDGKYLELVSNPLIEAMNPWVAVRDLHNLQNKEAWKSSAKIDIESPTTCSHDLKFYFGLNERYNYCTKCTYTDRT